MNRIIPFFLLGLWLISSSVSAELITAVDDHGDWAESSTWNSNRIPADGDLVLIPEGYTIEVTSNVYNATPRRPLLMVEVRGTLLMIGGSGQLNLECGSEVYTRGAGIVPNTGCNCNQIAIGLGEAVWKGMFSPSLENGSGVVGDCNNNLPVELVSFTAASAVENVLLNWSTASEVNFSHFEVERSANGVDYEYLATVSTTGHAYSYADVQPISGAAYYRLKAVDEDAQFQYSAAVSVNYNASSAWSVYPNPATEGYVSLSLNEGATEILMRDIIGNPVAITTTPTSALTYHLDFPSNLAPGVYFITVVRATGQQTKSIIVR